MEQAATQREVEVVIPPSRTVKPTEPSGPPPTPRRSSRVSKPTPKKSTSSSSTAVGSNDEDPRDAHGSDPDYAGDRSRKNRRATKSGNRATRSRGKKIPGKLPPPETPEEFKLIKENYPSKIPTKRNEDATAKLQQRSTEQKEKDLQSAKKEIKEHKSRLEAAQTDIAKLTRQLDSYQNDQLKLVAKSKVEAELDADLHNKFQGIFGGALDISRYWCIQDLRNADVNKVEQVFSCFLKRKSRPIATDRFLLAVKHGKVSPRLVLSTFINAEICTETFERPFAHLQLGLPGPDHAEIEVILNRIMKCAEEKSSNSQYKLRATILRAINDHPVEKAHWVESRAQRDLSFAHAERCREITNGIFDKVGILLREVTDGERHTRDAQMLRVVEQAMRLSCILNMQYPKVQFFFLDDLTERKFFLKDAWFRLHHSVGIEENDENYLSEVQALVGQPIDVVVAPAVARYGDKEGENYETENIVFRGSVWIVRNNESSRNTLDFHSGKQIPDEDVACISKSSHSLAPNQQMPESTIFDTSEAGQQTKSTKTTVASGKAYNLRFPVEPIMKVAEEKGEVDAQKDFEHSQSKIRNPENSEPRTSCSATSEQPKVPLDDIKCLNPGDNGSTSVRRERDEQQQQRDVRKECSDNEASSPRDNGAPSKQLPATVSGPEDPKPPLKRLRMKNKKNQGPEGETSAENQAGKAEAKSGDTDDSQTKEATGHVPTLPATPPPALASTQDPATRVLPGQSESDQICKKRKLSNSKVDDQFGDRENVEHDQPPKKQASFPEASKKQEESSSSASSPKQAVDTIGRPKDEVADIPSELMDQAYSRSKEAGEPASQKKQQHPRTMATTPATQGGHQPPQPKKNATEKPQKTHPAKSTKKAPTQKKAAQSGSQLMGILDSIN
ncbi:hypothetical protein CLAIMM_00019 [Cladophialophora immunda]|nr:hypothetical protein CLAIMM_00019 [Cladophialophora immunda]